MRHEYWIKFDNEPPRRYAFDTFDSLWHHVREYILKRGNMLEWMIRI